MKLPRDLSGRRLTAILCPDWGYVQVHQTGSHIILQTEIPSHHRIAVPAHAVLRIGTLNAILRDVAAHKGIDREVILRSV
ncbi:MAG: type II toxin-antitoxin system HicA family toxin [Acidobacteriaceae bacterium]